MAFGLEYSGQFHDQHQLAGLCRESTMSYLSQMVGLTVHNFVSTAVGIAVLVALIRGLRIPLDFCL